MLKQAVDTTQIDLEELAEKVYSRALGEHCFGQFSEHMDELQEAARELGYYFARGGADPTVDELADVLIEAIMRRRATSGSSSNDDGTARLADQTLDDGFRDLLRGEIPKALVEMGIRLQLTAAHVQPADCLPLSVDVTKDEIVISGESSLTTYNWKPDSWGNAVKRIAIRATHKASGNIEEKVFSVVATGGEDSGRKGGVLAEDLSEAEARALIGRIQDAVRVSLGITQPAIPVVDLPEAPIRLDAGSQSVHPAGIGRMVLNGVGKVLSTAGLVVMVVAVLCALSFGLPVAYKAGQHFAVGMFPLADASDARLTGPYDGELLRAVPSARHAPPLLPVPPLSK
ncbi:hypothetical protein [Burkholderia stagnalis]|uniref:hypothetical protein n=1 Tax=Burkholderia stagnalis TaxID=1503054 RepID=UPI0012DA5F30|nr:hypothetical protein [Burkholderia stagnalis]